MSRARYFALSGIQWIILSLAITPVAHQALAQLPEFPYVACEGKWSDEVAGTPGIVTCRARKRAEYIQLLQAHSDAVSGREFILDPIEGTTTTLRGTSLRPAVRILVRNINPYLFQYQVNLKRTAVVETAPAAFFKIVVPSVTVPAPSNAAANVLSTKVEKDVDKLKPDALVLRSECKSSEAATLKRLIARANALDTQLDSVRRSVQLLQAIESQYTGATEVLFNPSATSRDIQQSALSAVDGLHDYMSGVPAVLDSERRVHTDIKVFNGNPAPACASQEALELDEKRRELNSRSSALARSVSTLDSVDVRRTATSAADRIAKPLRDPQSFYRLIALDGSSGAEEVRVTVSRRKVTTEKTDDGTKPAPFDTVLTGATHVGLPRFLSIGGGMTWFAQQVRTYAITRKYSGNIVTAPDSVVSVISEQSADSRRMAPMITLGGELPLFGRLQNDVLTGLGLQFGVTANKDVSAIEYFVGASLHLLDDRMFVAYGDFASKDQSLAAGYAVGDRIPSAQTSPPLVTRTRWHDAFMVGVKLY